MPGRFGIDGASYSDHKPSLSGDEASPAEQEELLPHGWGKQNSQSRSPSRWAMIALVLLTNVATTSVTYMMLKGRALSEIDCSVGVYRNFHTPWMASVDRSFHPYRFQPFSLTPSRWSASAAKVGDSVDDAWKDLGTYYIVGMLPEEYADAYDIAPEDHHYLTPEDGPEVPYAGFPVNIQSLHQLHCLNLLRQGLYHNVDFYRADPNNLAWTEDQSDVFEAHLGHCVDELRQLIMCVADSDLVPYLKPDEPGKQPMPNFARRKMCRNFESLRQWAEENQWAAGFNATPVHRHDGMLPAKME